MSILQKLILELLFGKFSGWLDWTNCWFLSNKKPVVFATGFSINFYIFGMEA